MRTVPLTLAILVALDSDLAVLLWLAVLAPLFVALTFVGFLLSRRRPHPSTGRHALPGPADPDRWRGEHRTYAAPGRHSHARGRRLAGVSRQAQLEEHTVSVSAAEILRGLERPEDMPDVGRNGFSSWT